MKTEMQTINAPSITSKIKSSQEIQCYLLLLLPIIGFFVFTIYPVLWSAAKAFYFYDGVEANMRYVGIDNFITIFAKDTVYWKTWITTLKYTIYKLPIEVPFALILAFFLSKRLKGYAFFRSMYFLPNIISIAIVGVIFTNLFDYFGVINALLTKWGFLKEGIDWFGNSWSAMFVLVAGSVWNCFGVNVLYFSAALNNVPDELYESAEIDGAGTATKFFKITMPMIAPVFQTILLLAINGTLHVSEYIIVMTNGAPGGSTFTVGAYLINQFVPGFAAGTPNIGYGCALSIITSIIYGLVAYGYLKFSKNLSEVY